MPSLSFGEFKGVAIQEVPTEYLIWVATRSKVVSGEKKKAKTEIKARGKEFMLPSNVKRILHANTAA